MGSSISLVPAPKLALVILHVLDHCNLKTYIVSHLSRKSVKSLENQLKGAKPASFDFSSIGAINIGSKIMLKHGNIPPAIKVLTHSEHNYEKK